MHGYGPLLAAKGVCDHIDRSETSVGHGNLVRLTFGEKFARGSSQHLGNAC